MANLGTAQTRNFQIGNAELRIGTMAEAGRLTQKGHSVGLLQSASVNFSQNVAELKGGLPLQLVDSVITETTVTVSAQAYEYTRRNIRSMLNEGVKAGETDYAFTATLAGSSPGLTDTNSDSFTELEGLYGTSGATNETVKAGTPSTTINFTGCYPATGSKPVPAGNMIVGVNGASSTKLLLGLYEEGKPENLSIVEATVATVGGAQGIDSNATGTFTLTISDKTPVLFDIVSGKKIIIYTINPVGLGNSASTQYYTIDLLSKNHSSNLVQGFRFWKASIQGGMDYSFSNDSFAVTPMTFKVLLPTLDDLESTDPTNGLNNIKSIQEAGNPLGMFWTGQSK